MGSDRAQGGARLMGMVCLGASRGALAALMTAAAVSGCSSESDGGTSMQLDGVGAMPGMSNPPSPPAVTTNPGAGGATPTPIETGTGSTAPSPQGGGQTGNQTGSQGGGQAGSMGGQAAAGGNMGGQAAAGGNMGGQAAATGNMGGQAGSMDMGGPTAGAGAPDPTGMMGSMMDPMVDPVEDPSGNPMMDPMGTMTVDLGEGDGQDVITIGDSYMLLLLTGIQLSLERISGRDYRNYAAPGTVIEQILAQYETAKAQDPDIKTVVMTGGGNNILFSSCADEACKPIVDDVSMQLLSTQAQMATDGVQDVIIVGYGYPADQSKHWSLDYSVEVTNAMCKKDNMPRCHYINTIETLRGKIDLDGIHPTAAGYDDVGQLVWDYMQAEGIRR